MIVRVFTRAGLVALAVVSAACHSEIARDPIVLDGQRLTVDNTTSEDWTGVEIWLNTYYRVTASKIPAKTRFETSLNSFVAGFGQRFDFKRMQVKDLRLTAKLPDGSPLEMKYQMQQGGLVGALGNAVGGKR